MYQMCHIPHQEFIESDRIKKSVCVCVFLFFCFVFCFLGGGQTNKQRKADMKKFFRAVAESDIAMATKRSIKTARAPKHGGKKPCQRRRHRSERTQ